MCLKVIRRLILVLFIGVYLCSAVHADANEGTSTYKDYIFILVHGMNEDARLFTGGKSYGNLKAYLENNLDLKGHVFCYSFSNNRGDNFQLARELGDRSFHNPNPEMNGNPWLAQARIDFKKEYAKTHPPWSNAGKWEQVTDSVVPSRYILLTHSMGNYAARAYIYSDQLYEKGFYNNDVAKVVFIAPPLLGSDMALFSYKGYLAGAKGIVDGAIAVKDFFSSYNGKGLGEIMTDVLTDGGGNPYYPYQVSLDLAAQGIVMPRTIGMMQNEFNKVFSEKKTFEPASQGLIDLIPFSNATTKLKDAHPLSAENEPAYSIVYAKGVPVFDFASTFPTATAKLIDIGLQEKDAWGAPKADNYFDSSSPLYKTFSEVMRMDYQKLSLINPKFYNIGNSEGKLLSLLLARNGEGFFTNDGDGLVPEYSARGEGIKYLQSASKYSYTFKTQGFEDYLNGPLPAAIVASL